MWVYKPLEYQKQEINFHHFSETGDKVNHKSGEKGGYEINRSYHATSGSAIVKTCQTGSGGSEVNNDPLCFTEEALYENGRYLDRVKVSAGNHHIYYSYSNNAKTSVAFVIEVANHSDAAVIYHLYDFNHSHKSRPAEATWLKIVNNQCGQEAIEIKAHEKYVQEYETEEGLFDGYLNFLTSSDIELTFYVYRSKRSENRGIEAYAPDRYKTESDEG